MKDILSEWAIKQGFHIKEPDDHLELWHNDKLIVRSSQTGIEVQELYHQIEEVCLN